jgi:hypothetical protein
LLGSDFFLPAAGWGLSVGLPLAFVMLFGVFCFCFCAGIRDLTSRFAGRCVGLCFSLASALR